LRRIRWAPAAAHDLQGISDYLQAHYPSFVQPTIRKLYKAARSLKKLPNRGRTGQKDGTRELVMAPLPYIIVYGVEPDTVHIFTAEIFRTEPCFLRRASEL
jgi:plasmid stabilization system protein ParE